MGETGRHTIGQATGCKPAQWVNSEWWMDRRMQGEKRSRKIKTNPSALNRKKRKARSRSMQMQEEFTERVQNRKKEVKEQNRDSKLTKTRRIDARQEN
ncbi:hypothetical protein BDW75DRAFT_209574 [Aspergillus navahoensis]